MTHPDKNRDDRFGSGSMLESSTAGLRKFYTLGVPLALTALLIGVYYPIFNYDFIDLDTQKWVIDNAYVNHGLTLSGIRWAFTNIADDIYKPITWLSHMLAFEVFGSNPGGHHFLNLVIHIANCILLFVLFRKMTKEIWPSFFLSLLFGLHPLRVEPVVWDFERQELLASFFLMLTVMAYQGYVINRSKTKYITALLCFLVGLLSKPMIVTLPFLLFILDYWPLMRHNESLLKRVFDKIPFLILSIFCSALTFFTQQNLGAVPTVHQISFLEWIAHPLVAYVTYMSKTVYPTGLAILYPYPALGPFSAIVAFLILTVISGLVLGLSKRCPYLTVGWLWWLVALIPVIGIIPNGAIWLADRYTYLPCIGLFLMVCWGASSISKNWKRSEIVMIILASLVSGGLFLTSCKQVKQWRNTETLFTHAIQETNDNYTADEVLALYYKRKGDINLAIKFTREALRINPRLPNSHIMLAELTSDPSEYRKVIDIFDAVLKQRPNSARAHYELASAYSNLGETEHAIMHYGEALRCNPGIIGASIHNDLGRVLQKTHEFNEALEHYSEAIKINQDFYIAHLNLGSAYFELGRFQEAIDQYSIALKINPRFIEGYFNLGNTYFRLKRFQEAINSYSNALKLNPRFTEASIAIGNAYYQIGRFQDALDCYSTALKLNPSSIAARTNLVLVLLETGRREEAREQIARIKADSPQSADKLEQLLDGTSKR